jgi:transposase
MEKFEDVLERVEARRLSSAEAGEILGMSERSFRRHRRRFEAEGLEGLVDRRLDRPSPRAIPASEAAWMLELYGAEYAGWTAKHFHERLRHHYDKTWGYTWVKSRLQDARLLPKAPKRGAHRRKRPRKPCVGMMLHQDGSRHEWLAGRQLDLIVTLDDATSEIYSAFLVEEEGTASSFRALHEVFAEKGLACSLYTDRGSHYFTTAKAGETVDRSAPTQVGRALAQLGVEHIAAYSPEARGRSERAFATLQDRLVKELAHAGIAEVEAADRFIKEDYLPRHNARFAVAPELEDSAFVALARPEELAEILCVQAERVVERDNTLRYGGRRLQLPRTPWRAHYVKARVRVRAYPDGRLAVFHGPRRIAEYDASGALIEKEAAQRAA